MSQNTSFRVGYILPQSEKMSICMNYCLLKKSQHNESEFFYSNYGNNACRMRAEQHK